MTSALENARNLYLVGIRDGQPREAASRFTGERYTQHSTGVKDGQDGFIEFFETFIERNPERDIHIVRSFEDGDFVFMHAAQSLNGGESRWITMDILEADERGRMVEHWDVIEAWTSGSQVDGATEPGDVTATATSKALVEAYIDEVLAGGQADRLLQFVAPEISLHEPDLTDGAEALASSLTSVRYLETVLVVGSGELVATLSRVSIDGTEMAVMDLYRVVGERIVEHWSTKEPVPPASELANGGKF